MKITTDFTHQPSHGVLAQDILTSFFFCPLLFFYYRHSISVLYCVFRMLKRLPRPRIQECDDVYISCVCLKGLIGKVIMKGVITSHEPAAHSFPVGMVFSQGQLDT